MASRNAPKGKPQPQEAASNDNAKATSASPKSQAKKDPQQQKGQQQQQPKQQQGKKASNSNAAAPKQLSPKGSAEKQDGQKQEQAATEAKKSTSPNSTSPRGEEKGERTREAREKKPKKEKESGKGTVKSVLAGDRVVIYVEDAAKKAVWSPPAEREIKLSSIKAPKPYAKGDWGERKEEKFAWHSKNFLRELLIGKPVEFTVDAKADGREYGTVRLLPSRENIAEAIVREGWAEVSLPKIIDDKKDWRPSDAVQVLQALEEAAKKDEKGMWTTSKEEIDKAVPKIETEFDETEMYTSFKNKRLTAIVENVINGSMLRVLLLPFFREIVVKIAGVQSPLFRRKQGDEPFAREAHFTTERYLLQRRVDLVFTAFEQGKKKKDAGGGAIFHAEVILSEKSIGELLLSSGLADYVEWSTPKEKREAYRRLVVQAQQQSLRMWSVPRSGAQAAPSTQPRSQRGFSGIVKEVPNGSSLVVLNDSATPPQLVSVTFSSVNVPRLGVRDKPDEPFAWEAREFTRKKLIGKRVQVSLDYVRPEINLDEREKGKGEKKAREGNEKEPRVLPEKSFYTVMFKGKNIALALVEHGYATVVEHWGRERSPHYDALFLAQDRAKKKQLGLHGNAEQFDKHYTNDVSRVAKKAKSIFATLARKDERLQAIVEYVISGSRMKINIPAHNILVTFCLAGARCEGVPREDEVTEAKPIPPFSQEARDFTRNLCLHFDVEVELEGQDNSGAFRGYLWINGQNLARLLLREGLAKYTRSGKFSEEFAKDEADAKKDRKCLWINYDPAKDEEEKRARAAEEAAASKPRKEVVHVTEVMDGRCCYIQIVGEGQKKLTELMQQIAARNYASLPAYEPQQGEAVIAQFPADGTWYRAQVLHVHDNGEVDVIYGDYGNGEVIDGSLIRQLDPEFGLDKLKWQAHECYLAYLQTRPMSEDWGREAALAFKDLVWGKTLMASIEYRDGPRLYVNLWEAEPNCLFINGELVRQGLAKVEKRPPRHASKDIIKYLQNEQEDAFKNHRGLWEYGDDGEDDAYEDQREFGRGGKPKAGVSK